MDKEEKKKLRKQLLNLLNAPNADSAEIKRIGKLLGNDNCKGEWAERFTENAKKGSRGPYKVKFVDPDVYIQLRKEGKRKAEIAELLGIEFKVLHSEISIMRELGIIKKGDVPRHKRPLLFTMTREEYEIEQRTKTDAQIAKECGVSRSVVANRRKWWGFPRRNKKAELTYQRYRELKYKDGRKVMSDRDIERMFGYNDMTIHRLKNSVWDVEEMAADEL